MRISDITVQNFRLLENIELCLENDTTLIVGRNNSGKTSLTELFRRLLDDRALRFRFEDFSLGVHQRFWEAFERHQNNEEENTIREVLPAISISVTVEYSGDDELGTLSDFVIDLNEACTKAKIVVTYALASGKIPELFTELGEDRQEFFRALRERVPKLFVTKIEAEDPNDPTNKKDREIAHLRAVLQLGFINAQRALEDVSSKEKAVLGKVFERLFVAASSAEAGTDDQTRANSLKTAVEEVQTQIDTDFNTQLGALVPAFELFGYPGLADPQLRTETQLDVEQLLSNHTSVSYLSPDPEGINLPEAYNGLGPRNLIFILLKLFEFFREFTTRQPEAGVHLIFIEEPEAHLHPQMQAVFIRKLNEIRAMFEKNYNGDKAWPVQFVATTHSSHIANEAAFDAIRYFLATPREEGPKTFQAEVRDLRTGLSEEEEANREFLHKYMTLTRCDLLFADAAILVEGTTERLLLPRAIEKFDEAGDANLGGKYLSIMEVGGAYSHLFYNLVDFLKLRTLIITDLDSVDADDNRKKCKVSKGTHSSNVSINNWLDPDSTNSPTLAEIQGKTAAEKSTGNRRLAYQVPHTLDDACGRSFEDAFMLANSEEFEITGASAEERETEAWEAAKKVDKTKFALEYAINKTSWVIPKYIEEGLLWLSESGSELTEESAPDDTAQERADA